MRVVVDGVGILHPPSYFVQASISGGPERAPPHRTLHMRSARMRECANWERRTVPLFGVPPGRAGSRTRTCVRARASDKRERGSVSGVAPWEPWKTFPAYLLPRLSAPPSACPPPAVPHPASLCRRVWTRTYVPHTRHPRTQHIADTKRDTDLTVTSNGFERTWVRMCTSVLAPSHPSPQSHARPKFLTLQMRWCFLFIPHRYVDRFSYQTHRYFCYLQIIRYLPQKVANNISDWFWIKLTCNRKEKIY